MTRHAINVRYLVDTHGQPCTYRVKTLGTYDPSTSTVSGGSELTYTVNCHFANYNLEDIDGSNVVLGDRRALLPTVDTFNTAIPSPDIGDEIEGEGDKVSIVAVQVLTSGGSPICYICQVRE